LCPKEFEVISVSPTFYDFGSVNVGSSKSKIFTISNIGEEKITINQISLTGNNSSEFSIIEDNCSGKYIYPGSSLTFKVRFSPFSYGDKSAVVLIYYNDSEFTVPLQGNGGIGVSNSSFSGKVYDGSTGRTISGANVSIGEYSDTTDENGYYNVW